MFATRFRTLLSRCFDRRPRESAPSACVSLPLCARDEPAYVLLETARLNCERLRACWAERATGQERWLARLHRELGLAGYFASERLPSQQRQALLERARGRAEGLASTPEDLRPLAALIAEAQDAVLGALHVPELSDHMQQAHEQLSRVQAMLDERLGRALAAPSSQLAAREG